MSQGRRFGSTQATPSSSHASSAKYFWRSAAHATLLNSGWRLSTREMNSIWSMVPSPFSSTDAKRALASLKVSPSCDSACANSSAVTSPSPFSSSDRKRSTSSLRWSFFRSSRVGDRSAGASLAGGGSLGGNWEGTA